jgi:hypothetical protein
MAPATQLLGVLATGLPVLRRAFSFALGRKRNRSIEYVAMMRTALLDVAFSWLLRLSFWDYSDFLDSLSTHSGE